MATRGLSAGDPPRHDEAATPEQASVFERRREFRLLQAVVHPVLATAVLLIPLLWIPGATAVPLYGSIGSVMLAALMVLCEVLTRRGHLAVAAWFFLTVMQLTSAVAFFVFGGLFGPYVAFLPVVVCLAGLLRGGRAALAFMGLSIGVVVAGWVLEHQGVVLRNLDPGNPGSTALVVVVCVAITGLFLSVALARLDEARREREAFERERREAHRLEAVGRLAGGVAHDFNNLLTVILANADPEWAAQDPAFPLRERLLEIREAGTRAAQLTQQLLAFARRQVLEPRVLDLGRLLRDLEPILRRLLRENVELRLATAPDLRRVRSDPARLEQAVVNLAVNAHDAMPNGGILTLETRNAELDEEACRRHPELRPGSFVLLSVSDTGVGMSVETLERVFEPFFTTKRPSGGTPTGGTGLGLATVHGVVKQSGGQILVYSEPDRGTTFKIYLPVVDAPVEPGASQRPVVPRAGGGVTVLVVDDERSVRELTARMLERLGHRVLTAADGAEALERAAAHEGPIHVLLTDVVMPRMGGRDLARALREQRPEVRVVFSTGYAEEAVRANGHIERGTSVLPKPYALAELEAKLREVLEPPA
jgi:signal transduction histidine kinase